MINYKEELAKYEPVLEIDDIEDAIHNNELQDMFDILQRIAYPKSGRSGHRLYSDSEE